MGKCGYGHCVRCGDTQGPWSWFNCIGWLCDTCAEAEEDWQYDDDREDEEE